MKPVVAIVGQPNAGKSTLFNKLTKSNRALVDNYPGVTRDRLCGEVRWADTAFTLVDTGGFSSFDAEFASLVRHQVELAIEEADAVIMLFDGKKGPSPEEQDLVKALRVAAKPVFFCVNKIDNISQETALSDFYGLGIDELYPVSSAHGYGVNDILDSIVEVLPKSEPEPKSNHIRLAVIGRPNVGKSSLINRLLDDDRLVVSDQPGTTRDPVDIVCTVRGKEYSLIDTAGIRKRKNVDKKMERFSIARSLKSIDRCDVALILLDAAQGITEQDTHVAGYAWERGRACIIGLNKWDLLGNDQKTINKHIQDVRERFKFLSYAPVLTLSGLTGLRITKIFEEVEQIYEQFTTRVNTGRLNRLLEKIVSEHPPSIYKGRRTKIYYATQVSVAPPKFVCFVNETEGIHFSYERHMVNQFRKHFELDKTPLQLVFRKREKVDSKY